MDLLQTIQTKSKEWGIDPDFLLAVVQVESGGLAFGPDGKLLIRFEPQWFIRYAPAFKENFYIPGMTTQQLADQRFRLDVNSPWKWIHIGDDPATRTKHEGQEREYMVFEWAREKNAPAAYNSISMGFPQIMGFNAKASGFDSSEAMFKAMQESKDNQVAAFIHFLPAYSNGALVKSLQAGNIDGFIALYNGTSQIPWYRSQVQARLAQIKGR